MPFVVVAETPERVFCHRDFHSRNLMVLTDGSLAMVDIQDARWGPLTYDLASLLRDAYMRIDDSMESLRSQIRHVSKSLSFACCQERSFLDLIPTHPMLV